MTYLGQSYSGSCSSAAGSLVEDNDSLKRYISIGNGNEVQYCCLKSADDTTSCAGGSDASAGAGGASPGASSDGAGGSPSPSPSPAASSPAASGTTICDSVCHSTVCQYIQGNPCQMCGACDASYACGPAHQLWSSNCGGAQGSPTGFYNPSWDTASASASSSSNGNNETAPAATQTVIVNVGATPGGTYTADGTWIHASPAAAGGAGG